LIDNGPTPLTLYSINPSLSAVDQAASFTLTARGLGFTANSVVRWNGSARPTTFVSGTQLTATIFLSDVNGLGDFPVAVYDPAPAPTGTLTLPVLFHVVSEVFVVHLPLIVK
jgi:hypothetical protein